jgi:protein SCO1/2
MNNLGIGGNVRTNQKLILSVLATGTILLIILGIYWTNSTIKPVPTGLEKAFNPTGDFTLTEDSGKIFHLRDHRGKVILLFFGYTSCPDICPLTLAKLARARTLLGAAGQKVTTVFVTVDPQRDTSARLKEYLGYFDINAIGLTGTKTQIDEVVHAYNAFYEKVPIKSALGYIINHTTIVYLIDKQGKVRYLFHQDDSPEKMAKAIRATIKTDT